MLAALLAGFLIFSGGDGFAAKLFNKDTQSLVRQVVAEPERAEAAVRTLKQGQKDLEEVGKDLEQVVKDFTATDRDQSAGLDRLTPLMERATELRRLEQTKTLDRLFELRQALTPEEWGALLDKMK
jgi:hypothetical protein